MLRWFLFSLCVLPLAADTGTLSSVKGICPLKHTQVQAKISGPLARVTVTQEFENPFQEKIEAVYTFPLPADSAVDDMTMAIGDRTVRGVIKPREEARKIFEEARRNGHMAGLLDQERPNIFTQAVTNIAPGASVRIRISYVETTPFEAGAYQFGFPMVVAPRYIPKRVPDAARIDPPVTPQGTRAGHDISVEVEVDAGLPIEAVVSKTHEVVVDRPAPSRAIVRLKDQASIPNKDFLLAYRVAGERVADAVLAHTRGKDGYFTLILEPPARVAPAEAAPKELVFLLDTSGSMSGFPIEKAKETMQRAMDALGPRDTFNLITFSGDTHILFPQPVPATPENLRLAREFLHSRSGSGGTEMMRAIRAALAPSPDSGGRLRVVCFMTDGEVGNDLDIIAEVQQHAEARVFAFGIGSSVNRFLLDNVARYGRGEVEYVGLKDDGSAAARRFAERIRQPLLTDISIDWNGLAVSDVYPARLPDLFAAKPLVISGRYAAAGNGTIRLRGRMAGRDFTREIRVSLPAAHPENDVLATLWARRRVADLMAQDFRGLQRGAMSDSLKQEITRLGLEYRLMTPFTSFVAVEEKTVTEGGQPRRVEVPVEMPEGMSYEGVFGENRPIFAAQLQFAAPQVGFAKSGVVGGVPRMERMSVPPRRASAPRVDPAIAAVIARVKAGDRPGVDEARFVFGGDAYLRITLSDVSREALDQLKHAGLVITAQDGNTITGHAPVAALERLSQLPWVTWLAPR